MKNIELKKIILSNWRGQNCSIDFKNGTTTIKGENGSGKTSIMSAWFWLLSGYTDVVLPKNSNLFDNTEELTKDTPAAIVTALLEIDGNTWELRKQAIASFKRDKSSDTWVKASSDTYVYSIDKIDVSASEYTSWIEKNICSVDLLPYCIYGSFFSALSMDDKKEARKILEMISGEITRKDFKGDYSLLDEMFNKGYSVEQIQESFKKTLKEIDDKLKKIPEIIESKQSIINEISQTNFDKIELEIKECNEEIEGIDAIIANNSKAEQDIKDRRAAIMQKIDTERQKQRSGRNAHLDRQNAATSEIKHKISDMEMLNASAKRKNDTEKSYHEKSVLDLANEKKYLESLNAERDRLLKLRNQAKESVFNEEVCSACGQTLPEEQQDVLRKKFNDEKERRLEDIINQGKAIRNKIDATEKRISELEEIVAKGYKEEEMLDDSLLKEELAKIIKSQITYEETEEYKNIEEEIARLQNTMPEYNVDNSELTTKKRGLMSMLGELNQKLGTRALIAKAKDDIEELQAERTKLGADAALCEQKIDKCKEYVEERARIVSEKINTRLSLCEIQMWERQKNGELIPSCTIQSKDGVKLSTINHSQRLLAEAELQKMFCSSQEITLPVFYDEASVFDSKHKPCNDEWQTIFLQASDDSFLVVE